MTDVNKMGFILLQEDGSAIYIDVDGDVMEIIEKEHVLLIKPKKED